MMGECREMATRQGPSNGAHPIWMATWPPNGLDATSWVMIIFFVMLDQEIMNSFILIFQKIE